MKKTKKNIKERKGNRKLHKNCSYMIREKTERERAIEENDKKELSPVGYCRANIF